jgi:hypothetical protein
MNNSQIETIQLSIRELKNGYTYSPLYSITSNYETDWRLKTMMNPDKNEGITKTLVSAGINEYLLGNDYFSIKGNAFTLNDENQIQYGTEGISNNPYLLNNFLFRNEMGVIYLPFHPKFTYFPEDTPSQMKYGDNVPILNTVILDQNFIAGTVGRYGELRESDFVEAEISIYQNEELIYTDDYLSLLFNPLFVGDNEFRIKLSSSNTHIDNMLGSNITEIIFDNSLEDSHPPSLQMLQFRDSSNKIKHQFSADNEGVMRLAASDFYLDEELIFHYVPGNNVEVFYSLYDQNDWAELELIHYPEHFQTPKFGDYYEASLAGITAVGNDVWYDVKVICTDAAGNKQIQTISPAFQLNSTLKTEDVNSLNDLMVYPNPFTDHLYFEIPENLNSDYTLSITDFSGKQIHSQFCKANDLKKIDLSFLPKGIYIFSIEVDGKIVSKKVIKK